MSGASLIMSTFVGVDNLASCAEETRTPCKSLPTAFRFSISLLFTILFFVTAALTLATPWQHLADNAALARAYETKGIFAANYVIGVGAVLGLLPVVIGSFIHPVRVLFSMSQDRLLPGFLSKVGYNGIPVAPHFITGTAIALCSLVLDFRTLLEMSSISTLVQFVSSSIILLFIRYQPATVGICREYSDLDLLPNSTTAEDGLDLKDGLEFNETRPPKLVLLTTGDCKVPSEEKQYYSPIGDSPILSRQPIVKNASGVNKKPPSGVMNGGTQHASSPAAPEQGVNPLGPRQNSSPSIMSPSPAVSSSITFINRFKPPLSTEKSSNLSQTPTTYSEKDSLFSSYSPHPIVGSGGDAGVYGGRGTSDMVAVMNKDNKCFTGLRDRTQALNSLASSVSSSLVAISPSVTLHADEHSWRHTRYFLLIYVLSSTCLAATCEAWPSDSHGAWWAVTLLCVSLALMLVSALCVARQPQNSAPLYFKAPYVPLVPLLAITCDMLLIASLPFISWARFAMWIFPGKIR